MEEPDNETILNIVSHVAIWGSLLLFIIIIKYAAY